MKIRRIAFIRLAFMLLVFSVIHEASAKTVHYELTATLEKVNLSGKKEVNFAIALNGGIPAPKLEFTEGDDAEIVVKNLVPEEELSIHWHGILLPPEEDGVPYVNTPPIRSGEAYTFRFKIRQNGTYWYHSHTSVQEQKGVYGPIVIHPKKKTIAYDRDVVIVLSDWSDENPDQVLKNLRKDGDYYTYKKGTMRSWLGAIQAGGLGSFILNEWTRMGGMDFSDVGYDAFLINGKKDLQLAKTKPGEKIRLRIINSGASSYFNFSLGQAPMNVISVDGVDIKPVLAKEILIGSAETYDILFQVPDNKNYELRVTAQDGTGFASGWMGGDAEKVYAPVKPKPDLYMAMDHGSMTGMADMPGMSMNHASKTEAPPMDHSGMSAMEGMADMPAMNHAAHAQEKSKGLSVIETLTVDDLEAQASTEFPKNSRIHEVKLVLDGDMNRYIWHINGKAMNEERTIEINEGDIVKFTFVNNSMMHHPMHLHGHFFRVLNKKGSSSPMKHTVDVPPFMTRVIEFRANEPGEWMLHCHNLYHMKTGMARVVKYSSFTPKKEIASLQKHDPHLHDHWYHYGTVEASSNHAQAYLRSSQTWSQFEARIETRNTDGKNFSFAEPWEIESDLLYRRWFGKYLSVVGGGLLFDKRLSGAVGVSYIFPLLVQSELLLDHRGQIRLDLQKRFQWTSTIFSDANFTWRPNQGQILARDLEYEISLMYAPTWAWSAGLMLTERTLGAGVHFQF